MYSSDILSISTVMVRDSLSDFGQIVSYYPELENEQKNFKSEEIKKQEERNMKIRKFQLAQQKFKMCMNLNAEKKHKVNLEKQKFTEIDAMLAKITKFIENGQTQINVLNFEATLNRFEKMKCISDLILIQNKAFINDFTNFKHSCNNGSSEIVVNNGNSNVVESSSFKKRNYMFNNKDLQKLYELKIIEVHTILFKYFMKIENY